jgi:hypothetical protein
MKEENKDIWFPAKKYGIGWGLPVTWQGWAVSLSYLFLVLVGAFTFGDAPLFLASALIFTIAFISICIKKGEKLKWRWGDK